ncbi:MAG: hypothetical protein UHD07_07995 [Ruminobacter sp.]|nr:hypothetical protein [Ruminobacter sp.]
MNKKNKLLFALALITSLTASNTVFSSDLGIEFRRPSNKNLNDDQSVQTVASARIKELGTLLEECGELKTLAPQKVPSLKSKVVDMEAIHSKYEIKNTDTLNKLLTSVKTILNNKDVSRNKILVALLRENPKAFNNLGAMVGKTITIPSAERILLEEENEGKKAYSMALQKSLKSYEIPSLYLPWVEEQKAIDQIIKENSEINDKQKLLKDEYDKCVLAYNKKVESKKNKLEQEAKDALAKKESQDKSKGQTDVAKKDDSEKDLENKSKTEQKKTETSANNVSKEDKSNSNTKSEEVSALEYIEQQEIDISDEDLMIAEPKEEKALAEAPKVKKQIKLTESGKKIIKFSDKANADKASISSSNNNAQAEGTSGSVVKGSKLVLNSKSIVSKDSKGKQLAGYQFGSKEEAKNLKLDENVVKYIKDNEEHISKLEAKIDVLISLVQTQNEKIEFLEKSYLGNLVKEHTDTVKSLEDEDVYTTKSFAYYFMGFVYYTLILFIILFIVTYVVLYINRHYSLKQKCESNKVLKFILNMSYFEYVRKQRSKFLNKIRKKIEAEELRERQENLKYKQEEFNAEEEKRNRYNILTENIKRGTNFIRKRFKTDYVDPYAIKSEQSAVSDEEEVVTTDYKPTGRFYAYDSEPIEPVAIGEIEEPLANIRVKNIDMPITPKVKDNTNS